MFDTTIHLGDLIVAGGFLLGGGRFAWAIGNKLRALDQTVYGSDQPPVEGMVKMTRRHDDILRQIKQH